VEQSRLHVLEPAFFANGAEAGGVRERALGYPSNPLVHSGAWRRRAGSGKGELCALHLHLHRPYAIATIAAGSKAQSGLELKKRLSPPVRGWWLVVVVGVGGCWLLVVLLLAVGGRCGWPLKTWSWCGCGALCVAGCGCGCRLSVVEVVVVVGWLLLVGGWWVVVA
jgi:hypothetical protein